MRRHLRELKERVAYWAIPPSALRNQGASNVRETARGFVTNIKLGWLQRLNEEDDFSRWLDRQTKTLQGRLPSGSQNWGTARKALNLFLLGVCFNRQLAEEYNLRSIEELLEVPLDRLTMSKIRELDDHGPPLPKVSIKRLSPEQNTCYQFVAREIARKKRVARIYLDILYGPR